MLLGVDLTDLPKGMREKLHKVCTDENAVKLVKAKARQEQIAKFYRDNPPRAVEGIGGMTMSYDSYWINYFRWLTGEKSDDEVKRWMAKKWDAFKVRHTGTKLQVGYGSTPERGEQRKGAENAKAQRAELRWKTEHSTSNIQHRTLNAEQGTGKKFTKKYEWQSKRLDGGKER